MIDEPAIRAIVVRLARPSAAGAHTIDRAAILAEGADCAAIEAWIVHKGGEPQGAAVTTPGHGLHAERATVRSSRVTAYVLPASALG